MNYYLHRIPLENATNPTFDYSGESIDIGDKFVLYSSHTLDVIGCFTYDGTKFTKEKTVTCNLKDVMKQLSFILEVTDRTKRMFKKKTRKITKEDYLLFFSFHK